MNLTGDTLLFRRQQGLCLKCGVNSTGQEKSTGFRKELCAPCQARADAEQRQRDRLAKRSRGRR